MKPFLHSIAENLIHQNGYDLRNIAVFFPNRTGIHFFMKALSVSAPDKPLWAPVCMTPGMQMEKASGLVIGNKIRLAAELHHVYRSILQREPEPFERFFPWADLLINDFDDIDKYLADARMLYANLAGLKEINEQFAFLTEEQILLIKRFWRSYEEPKITEPKVRFLRIWEKLYEVYQGFTQVLSEKGFAYEGFLHRKAVENPKTLFVGMESVEKVLVVGFNRLNACEKSFLNELRKSFPVQFYYDEHPGAAKDLMHEGGRFFRETSSFFPPSMPETKEFQAPEIEIIYVTGNTSAVKITAHEIHKAITELNNREEDILVMLPDEKQLIPLLYSLPESVQRLNITSGLGLAETPVISLVKLLYALRKTTLQKSTGTYFRISYVLKLLRHPYINFGREEQTRQLTDKLIHQHRIRPERAMLATDDFFSLLFELPSEISFHAQLTALLQSILKQVDAEIHPFERIVVQTAVESARGVAEIITREGLPRDDKAAFMLINSVLRSTRIPFEGRPVEGMQIMGPLETRNLDFKTVIIPAMADDQFPGTGNPKSYIPFALRRAFGMPLPEDRTAEFSHIFFRLLNRAERVVLICNTSADAMSTGEPSRFILRLESDNFYKYHIRHKSVSEKVTFRHSAPIEIMKTGHVLKALVNYTLPGARPMYPTAINTYLTCSLRFYFRYIASIKEKDDLSDVADNAAFGSIFHNIMEWIYEDWVGKEIQPEEVLALADRFDALSEKAFKEHFGYDENESFDFEGESLIQREVIRKYVMRLLEQDAFYAPFTLAGLEHNATMRLDFESDGKPFSMTLGAKIDRVDVKNGVARIMDYKTGADELKYTSLESLFDTEIPNRNKAAFQTWLYGLIYGEQYPGYKKIQAGVYSVRKLFENPEVFNPLLQVKKDPSKRNSPFTNVENLYDEKDEFMQRLKNLFAEMFSEKVPFTQTDDLDRCSSCPYKEICRR
jgi:CRISPR/Cas system-associated exonuclease Cas4 (RecB family)